MAEIDEKRPRWREWLNDLFPPELDAEHLGFQDLLREAAARELGHCASSARVDSNSDHIVAQLMCERGIS